MDKQMDKREENLKKINEELEKLDDEQLEQVAGGGIFLRKVQSIEPNTDQNTTANQVGDVKLLPRLR